MIVKIEKLIDVWTEVGLRLSRHLEKEAGEALPLTEAPAPKARKAKKAAAPVIEDAFGLGENAEAAAEAAPEASPEDQFEARRRCQEAMGIFIRCYLKATPPGLDRAKAILNKVCGRAVVKLEDLTYADHVKLIPVFEAEVDKAEKAAKA